MRIFHTDLDNTLIYSWKHDIGEKKRNVELYQGREVSWISGRTFSLLREIKKRILVVPTSTRTIEQYQRIDLGVGAFEYALVCNGGVLLVNGEKDGLWYRESLKMTEKSAGELDKALRFLDRDTRRIFDLRLIENLFVFTKCDFPEDVVRDLKKELDPSLAAVCNHGSKVYVLPKNLDKGTAVVRFREYMNAAFGGGSHCRPEILAAGDSAFDVSMLEAADQGFAPPGFQKKYRASGRILEMDEKKLFSEAVLEACLKEITR